MQEMTVGPALDRATCEALHAALTAKGRDVGRWEPTHPRVWHCLLCDLWLSVGRHECSACGAAEVTVSPTEYPAVSTDGTIALAALEEMRGLGWESCLDFSPQDPQCSCFIGHTERVEWHWTEAATSPSEAICRAIVAVLPEVQL